MTAIGRTAVPQPRAHIGLAPNAHPVTPNSPSLPASSESTQGDPEPTGDVSDIRATGPMVVEQPAGEGSVNATTAPRVVEVLPIAARPGDPVGTQYVKLQDGRIYRRSPNPQSPGVTDYLHVARGMDPQGNRIQLAIVYAQFEDGAFQRLIQQQVDSPNGDSALDRIVGAWDKNEKQVVEESESTERATLADGTQRNSTESTTSEFADGQRIKRTTDIVNKEYAEVPDLKAPGPEKITVQMSVHGVWDNGGRPIVDAPGPTQTIPVIDRTQSVTRVTPGAGLHTDRDRVLSYELHSSGPVNQLTHDPMKLLVRFEGNKDAFWKQDQYIERELKVPVNAQGQPQMGQAEEVRTDDHQAPHVKAMMQARIWGGFASNIGIIASAYLGGILGGIGRPLVYTSLAASGAETVGEAHALATHRTDGSWPRMAMSVYDSTWTGLYALVTRGRSGNALTGASGQGRSGAAALGLGSAGIAGHTALNVTNPVGANALDGFDNSAREVLGLNLRDRGGVPANWRPVPAFDASAELTPLA